MQGNSNLSTNEYSKCPDSIRWKRELIISQIISQNKVTAYKSYDE
jgi:hypothetical protein